VFLAWLGAKNHCVYKHKDYKSIMNADNLFFINW